MTAEWFGTLYTKEVRDYIFTRDWPRGLQLDVFEDEYQLNFIFYRDNWIKFSNDEHLKIASIVKEVMEKLRADGIPCYMGRMESRYGGK